MPKIFDAHSHYMPPEVAESTAFFKVGWSDIERQLSLMDDNDIEKALLLYPTSDAHLKMGWSALCSAFNRSIAAIADQYKDRFIPSAILPLDNVDHLKEALSQVQDMGIQVVSLPSSYQGKFLDDPLFLPVLEYAQKNNILVHVHPQIMQPIGEERVKDPLLTPVLEYVFDVSMCIGKMMMEGVFLKYPNVKFVFAHYGGVLPFLKERFDNTYLMLRKRNFVKDLTKTPSDYFKNLYFDISGSRSFASLLCALEMADASQILFGSDLPANQDLAGSIAIIKKSSLSDEQKSLLLRNPVLQ